MSGRIHSQLTRNRVLGLYRGGLGPYRIKGILGAEGPSVSTISLWVIAAGIQRSHSRSMILENSRRFRKDFDELRRAAYRLATDRLLSANVIARMLGCHPNTIRRAIDSDLRHANGDAVSRRYWQADLPDAARHRHRRDLVIALRSRGHGLLSIAAAVGMSVPTVWRYCRIAGLTRANRRTT